MYRKAKPAASQAHSAGLVRRLIASGLRVKERDRRPPAVD